MLKKIVSFALFSASMSFAQVAAPAQPNAAPAAQVPMSYGLSQSLAQLEQAARSTVVDLSRVRVDRWKADGRYKDQSRANVESVQRNLDAALPSLIQQVRQNPSSIAAVVKLYRNLNAVYDVMASVTESTGAFGSKDDYNMLASDLGNIENVRRSVADELEQMAANQDAQLNQLRAQIRAQQQAAAAAPPKKVVVDDNAPKKKPTSTKKKAASSGQTKPQ
ncbi:MAG TPA: hypothetical protein VN577_11870 [Terriglobales bacterium]|nr:hypothetical protein [Terriglobales bacterium]